MPTAHLTERNATLKAKLTNVRSALDDILDQLESSPDGLDSMIQRDVEDAWGTIDFLINNFGWLANQPEEGEQTAGTTHIQ